MRRGARALAFPSCNTFWFRKNDTAPAQFNQASKKRLFPLSSTMVFRACFFRGAPTTLSSPLILTSGGFSYMKNVLYNKSFLCYFRSLWPYNAKIPLSQELRRSRHLLSQRSDWVGSPRHLCGTGPDSVWPRHFYDLFAPRSCYASVAIKVQCQNFPMPARTATGKTFTGNGILVR